MKSVRTMTREELETYNGQNGKPSYIAYKGKIYDVTGSEFWKEGIHMDRHIAGYDLSTELEFAPHTEESLAPFPIVGHLSAPEAPQKSSMSFYDKEFYRKLYHRFHPHPVSVHFPIAGIIFSSLFLLFYFFTGKTSFENGHFYLLILSCLGGFAAFVTGILSWWINYDFLTTRIFKLKFLFTIIVMLGELFLILWRINYHSIIIEDRLSLIVYSFILITLNILVLLIAFLGGKLTYR